MPRFVYVMQHTPSPEQAAEVKAMGLVPVELADKAMLIVPDDPTLNIAWFEDQAFRVEEIFGGFSSEDVVMVMGQQQLSMAIQARAWRAGCRLVEAVTARESVETVGADGAVTKTAVFRHRGFREVHNYFA